MTIQRLASAAALLVVLACGATANAQPRKGWHELRLGPSMTSPFALVVPSGAYRIDSEGDGVTMFGFQGGFGWFLLDVLELGVEAFVTSYEIGDADFSQLGAWPFLKLLIVPDRIGFFGEVKMGVAVGVSDASSTAIGFGLGFGIEGFITRDWSIFAGPTYRFLTFDTDPDSTNLHIFGLEWGIATYF